MDINYVLRAQKARVIKIAGLEVERVESLLLAVFGIVVTTGDIRFDPKPGLERCVIRIASVKAGGPCQDGVAAETPKLQNLFGVPVPIVPLAKLAPPHRMPVFFSRPRTVPPIVPS